MFFGKKFLTYANEELVADATMNAASATVLLRELRFSNWRLQCIKLTLHCNINNFRVEYKETQVLKAKLISTSESSCYEKNSLQVRVNNAAK